MRVLITGGSEGIGYAFAEYFANENASLILVARNAEKLIWAQKYLEQKYNCEVMSICMDLSEMNSGEQLYMAADGKNLDVLVNCAGYGKSGRAEETDIETDERMVGVNGITPMTLSKLFVRDHKKGILINVCSTGAFQPGPYIASYYASKSFLLSYTQALALENKDSELRIIALCPGPVDTAFYEKSGGKMSGFHESAEHVVSYCMSHLNQKVVIPGWYNRVVMLVPSKIRSKALLKIKKR